MIERNIKSTTEKKNFRPIVFPSTSTSIVAAQSITASFPVIQEKLLYITLSLVVFFLIRLKIRSRVSSGNLSTGEGGEKK